MESVGMMRSSREGTPWGGRGCGLNQPFGTVFSSSASHTSGEPSEGARQSPRGDSEPPDEILGPLGSAERLNWLAKKRRRNSASQWRISFSSKARMLPAGTLAGHAPFFTSCQAFHDRKAIFDGRYPSRVR